MDTRLTWTFGDDDFLPQEPGELVPLSPTFSVGERPPLPPLLRQPELALLGS